MISAAAWWTRCPTAPPAARRAAGGAFLAATAAALLVACGSQFSRDEALDRAADDARDRVRELQVVVGGLLARSSSAAAAEDQFSSGNRMVLDSSSSGSQAQWDVVVVGTGMSGSGVGAGSLGVRACLRLTGQVRNSQVAVVDSPCPPGIDNRNGIAAYDETVRLFEQRRRCGHGRPGMFLLG